MGVYKTPLNLKFQKKEEDHEIQKNGPLHGVCHDGGAPCGMRLFIG